jgi:hypothetical protein
MPVISDPTVEDHTPSEVLPEPDLAGAVVENGDRTAETVDAAALIAPEPPEVAEAIPERPPLHPPVRPLPFPIRKRAVRGR